MQVHLVDGTYELFRHYFGAPPGRDTSGNEVGALRGVLSSLLYLVEEGATHIAVATDHVIESFRNDLWHGYKTGAGIEPELLAQFHPLERALESMGVVVWPMVEFEADDAMASGAVVAGRDERVERVILCTPDKDLSQCVVGTRVVQLDRRQRVIRDRDGVIAKFGVPPESIPDYLALVGDAADGFPGVPGWGAKSTATVLAHYGHLDRIPRLARLWEVPVRGAMRLADALRSHEKEARLFRELATLRTDAPVDQDVDALQWTGPRPGFEEVAGHLGAPELARRALVLSRSLVR